MGTAIVRLMDGAWVDQLAPTDHGWLGVLMSGY